MGSNFKTILKRMLNFISLIGLFIKEYFRRSVFVIANSLRFNESNTFTTFCFRLHGEETSKNRILSIFLNHLPGLIAFIEKSDDGHVELVINYFNDKKIKDNYVINILDKLQSSINSIFILN